MSFIRPNAASTVWKTFGATPRAWNGTRLSHARELTRSGGRVGCSASRERIARDTRATTGNEIASTTIDDCPIASSVEAAVPAARSKTAFGNSPLVVDGSCWPRNVGLPSSTATASVKLSLRLKSRPLPQETVLWLPRASRSSTRLQK